MPPKYTSTITVSKWIRSFGLFPLSQHFEKSNSHIANILIFTPEWSAGYSLFSQVTVCYELSVYAIILKDKIWM